MFLTRAYDDRLEHRYDSDATFYLDNRSYYVRRLRLEEERARRAAQPEASKHTKLPAATSMLRRTWGWLRPQ